ncbi:MAG: hypothetical protein EAX91_05375 [Candidatus Lokiarchaeota archaeon]|nr:hypothetical protein [Candidatus Lokiarchaeota archaeon]
MLGKIIVLSELNKELYSESNLYDKAIEEISSQLINFIRYNPDDLNKEVVKKIITRGITKIPKKTIGPVHLKGEEAITIQLTF